MWAQACRRELPGTGRPPGSPWDIPSLTGETEGWIRRPGVQEPQPPLAPAPEGPPSTIHSRGRGGRGPHPLEPWLSTKRP